MNKDQIIYRKQKETFVFYPVEERENKKKKKNVHYKHNVSSPLVRSRCTTLNTC
jgi:hypothetical protein